MYDVGEGMMMVFFKNILRIQEVAASLHSERCCCFNFFQAFFVGEVMNNILV